VAARARRCPPAVLAAWLVLGAAPPAAAAQPDLPPDATACSFGAFVRETDPAGLNVRDAPATGGRILGTLPPVLAEPGPGGLRVMIEVDVKAVRGGWFLVEGARDNTLLSGRAARQVFQGSGWVSGRKLTVKSQAKAGRDGPAGEGAPVLRLADGSAFDGDAFVDASRLVDCRGAWAKVELDRRALPASVRALLRVEPAAAREGGNQRPRAWFDQICGVQETSCDAPSAVPGTRR
jgi:hypothetical protein